LGEQRAKLDVWCGFNDDELVDRVDQQDCSALRPRPGDAEVKGAFSATARKQGRVPLLMAGHQWPAWGSGLDWRSGSQSV
jgi:hypothetical protein